MNELRLPRPLPHQVPVLDSDARFKVWRAGRRVGKSRGALLAGVAGHGPSRIRKGMLQHGDIAWFAPDYKQSQAIWREEVRPRFSSVDGITLSESERRISLEGGGSLQLLSAENIDAARGRKLDGALLDEGGYFDLEYAFNSVIRPALADRQGWAMFCSTTNAGHDGNSMKRVPSYFNLLAERVMRGEMGAEWAHFHNRTADNPRIPEAEIAALYAEYPPGSATAAQELDAELGVAGGRYYTVDRSIHLVSRADLPESLPAWWEFWGAYDWGYAHWSVFGVFCRNRSGATFLLDTYWARRSQDDEYAMGSLALLDDLKLPVKLPEVYAGHDCWQKVTARGASGITTAEVFANHGLYLAKADIDRANGGRAMRRELAASDAERSRGFYIVDTPNNRRVIAQIEETIPDPNDVNKPLKVNADVDGKGGDDGSEMVRYGIATRVPLPTEPKAYTNPWEHGRDMTEFKPYTDEEYEPIGELGIGF